VLVPALRRVGLQLMILMIKRPWHACQAVTWSPCLHSRLDTVTRTMSAYYEGSMPSMCARGRFECIDVSLQVDVANVTKFVATGAYWLAQQPST